LSWDPGLDRFYDHLQPRRMTLEADGGKGTCESGDRRCSHAATALVGGESSDPELLGALDALVAGLAGAWQESGDEVHQDPSYPETTAHVGVHLAPEGPRVIFEGGTGT